MLVFHEVQLRTANQAYAHGRSHFVFLCEWLHGKVRKLTGQADRTAH